MSAMAQNESKAQFLVDNILSVEPYQFINLYGTSCISYCCNISKDRTVWNARLIASFLSLNLAVVRAQH